MQGVANNCQEKVIIYQAIEKNFCRHCGYKYTMVSIPGFWCLLWLMCSEGIDESWSQNKSEVIQRNISRQTEVQMKTLLLLGFLLFYRFYVWFFNGSFVCNTKLLSLFNHHEG